MKKNKALAVPFVLWAILFIAVPLVMVVWYGVTVEETPAYVEVEGIDGQTMFQLEDGTLTAERPEKQTVVSLANFKRMLEPTYLKLLLRSLKIALFTTILCLLLGYPVALILSGRDFKRPGLWLMLIILPMWMNFLLRTYSWMSILENSGILNSWIASLRDAIPAFDRWLTSMGVGKKIIFLYNENAVVLGMVYNYLFLHDHADLHRHRKDGSQPAGSRRRPGRKPRAELSAGDAALLPAGRAGRHHDGVCSGSHDLRHQPADGRRQGAAHRRHHPEPVRQIERLHFGSTLSLLVMVVVLAFMGGLQRIDKEEEPQKEVRIL